MNGFVTVAFRVSDEEAKRMAEESVYLDVHGFVRWSDTGRVVEHASIWSVLERGSNANAD